MAELRSMLSRSFRPAFIVRCITDISQVVTGVLFGIAIVTAAARMTIRLWVHMKLRLDDYLLLFSCICLATATGVLYYGTPMIFLGEELTSNPAAISEPGVNVANILHDIDLIPKIDWTYSALSWVAIFFVKFGFLSLFRQLVDRLPPMYRLWKGVLTFTGLVFAFAVCDGFIACPKMGLETGGKQDFP